MNSRALIFGIDYDNDDEVNLTKGEFVDLILAHTRTLLLEKEFLLDFIVI